MRRGLGVWGWAWGLFGLLAVAAALFWFGARETSSNPSALSYGPSGTRASVEMLRELGFRVRVDRASRPRLDREELALAFWVPLGYRAEREEGAALLDPVVRAVVTSLEEHVREGGNALLMVAPSNLGQATAKTEPRTATFLRQSPRGRSWKLSRGLELSSVGDDRVLRVDTAGYAMAADPDGGRLLDLFGLGKGTAAILQDATPALNGFLAQHDNAAFLARTVASLDPGSKRVVVLEALAGSVLDPGLLESIGPWAQAAWWQLVLVFVVLAYSLGKRFGLPIPERTPQRGSRELVDAYADVMARSRKPHMALRKIVQEADRQLRARFKIPADVAPACRNRELPPDLARALTEAEAASSESVAEREAVRLAVRLEREMARLPGVSRARRRRG
jgi:hypothetical protein